MRGLAFTGLAMGRALQGFTRVDKVRSAIRKDPLSAAWRRGRGPRGSGGAPGADLGLRLQERLEVGLAGLGARAAEQMTGVRDEAL